MLKGVLLAKNTSSSEIERQKLISGGEQMKYQGITTFKNKHCNSWLPDIEQVANNIQCQQKHKWNATAN